MGNSVCAKKIGAEQLGGGGGQTIKLGGEGQSHCCPDVEPLLLQGQLHYTTLYTTLHYTKAHSRKRNSRGGGGRRDGPPQT